MSANESSLVEESFHELKGKENTSENQNRNLNHKKNPRRSVLFFVGLCLVLVAGLSVLHLKTREKVPEHQILVETSDGKTYIDLDNIKTESIRGEVVNGKGEVKEVSGEGILLSSLLKDELPNDYSTILVCALDEYQATLTKEELLDEGKAYLFLENNSARLYVFGDENSKRNVTDVVKIVIE